MVDHGHRDMEGWGVYSILKEAGRLLYQHIRILRPFILAFILPLALVLFLEVIGIACFLTWVGDQAQLHHLGDIFGHHHRHSGFHAAFSKAPNPPVPVFLLLLLLVVYIIIFLLYTISWLLGSLASAAIAKAIHHIYSSNSDSNTASPNEDGNSPQALTQSIFTSLPHSFYRIFIISVCFFVVDISVYLLLALPSLLWGSKFGPDSPLLHLQVLLWNELFVILDFWYLVSVQVVVLESQHDGWAALQRSARLVKAKAATAVGLLVLYSLAFWVLNYVLVEATAISVRSAVLYVVAGLLAVGYLAAASFWAVVVTVFYFVSKSKSSGGREEGRLPEEDPLNQALVQSVEN